MIAHLRGHISKTATGVATVDVSGVGYLVKLPLNTWDDLQEGTEQQLFISTYVREDRLDLYGFADSRTKLLFEELIERQGIGPKMALELCAVPRGLLLQAIHEEDSNVLTSIKGIGKKTAEKLLIELKSLAEKHADIFMAGAASHTIPAQFDRDALAALSSLGYSMPDIITALEKLPKELKTTEERVTAALQAL